MLNQRYVVKTDAATGRSQRLLRLAIGSRSQLCQVHPAFKLVVVVEAEHAWAHLDLAMLNRFEKQLFTPEDVLSPRQHALCARLKAWLLRVSDEAGEDDLGRLVCGYHQGLLPSLVLALAPDKVAVARQATAGAVAASRQASAEAAAAPADGKEDGAGAAGADEGGAWLPSWLGGDPKGRDQADSVALPESASACSIFLHPEARGSPNAPRAICTCRHGRRGTAHCMDPLSSLLFLSGFSPSSEISVFKAVDIAGVSAAVLAFQKGR